MPSKGDYFLKWGSVRTGAFLIPRQTPFNLSACRCTMYGARQCWNAHAEADLANRQPIHLSLCSTASVTRRFCDAALTISCCKDQPPDVHELLLLFYVSFAAFGNIVRSTGGVVVDESLVCGLVAVLTQLYLSYRTCCRGVTSMMMCSPD